MSTAGVARGLRIATEMNKSAVRKMVRDKLRAMSADALSDSSAKACKNLLQSSSFVESKSLGIYVFCERLREVDTWSVLDYCFRSDVEKHCFVPKIDPSKGTAALLEISSKHDLEEGAKGILEPSEWKPSGAPRKNALDNDEPLDILVVPGLAFDRAGNRLGRGGGYYDRLLLGVLQKCKEKQWPKPLLVALAFEEQMLDEIPMDSHDMPVDVVVTPSQWIDCQMNY